MPTYLVAYSRDYQDKELLCVDEIEDRFSSAIGTLHFEKRKYTSNEVYMQIIADSLEEAILLSLKKLRDCFNYHHPSPLA